MERSHQQEKEATLPQDQQYIGDFGSIDFMDEANFDQFINLIRDEINETNTNIDFPNAKTCYDQADHYGPFGPISNSPPLEIFNFNVPTGHFPVDTIGQDLSVQFPSTNYVGVKNNDGYVVDDDDDDDDDDDGEDALMDGEESSATTTTTTTTNDTVMKTRKKKSNKTDRSRTLISERKRRGRMKEKLYALRSLVPNITKMDKASIIGDAVLYVQDLQMQAKKLKAEIAGLESSLSNEGNSFKARSTTQSSTTMNTRIPNPVFKKIFKMDVFQVEERGFYARMVTNKEKGVAAYIYKAIETFNVQSSNLAASDETYVLTFTFHVQETQMDIQLPDVKIWVASAFIHQGFEFESS